MTALLLPIQAAAKPRVSPATKAAVEAKPTAKVAFVGAPSERWPVVVQALAFDTHDFSLRYAEALRDLLAGLRHRHLRILSRDERQEDFFAARLGILP